MTAHDTFCNRIDDLLLDASPLAMETAARHARECDECAAKLAAWDEIGATARTLRHEWSSDLLWPRIDRALRAERRHSKGRWLWQIAAAIALTVALGGTMFYALRIQNKDAAFDRDILRVSALDRVDAAEKEHLRAIHELEQIAGTTVDDSSLPIMVSYREKLMLLDDAIAECEQLIQANRQNAHLRRQLLAMYTEKRQTLEEVLREESSAINR